MFIFGYLVSNTAINSSTSSCASNIQVTPFSSQSATSTGICIIILKSSNGTTLFSMIGYTYVLWISNNDTGHEMNTSQKNLNILHSQPLSFYDIINYAFHSNNSEKMKSRQFCTLQKISQIPITNTTLNLLSRHLHGHNHVEHAVPT